MGASNPLATVAAAGLLLAVLGGCASGPEPKLGDRATEAKDEIERTKQAAREGTAAEIPEAEDAETPAASEPPPPAVDPTAAVHFESARQDPEPPKVPTLFEAAEAERERREMGGAPPAGTVITNANLGRYAKGGHLTVSGGEGSNEGTDDPSRAPRTEPAEDPETYWRTRVRDARLAWRAADDRVAALEKEVARLRFDFYSQDDPAYRDLEIKPAWDRALAELAQARMRVDEFEVLVEQTLAEGAEAGALPGWLREGIDFEPAPSSTRSGSPPPPGTVEAIEPPIMDDPPR
jgi:hypothetical protein